MMNSEAQPMAEEMAMSTSEPTEAMVNNMTMEAVPDAPSTVENSMVIETSAMASDSMGEAEPLPPSPLTPSPPDSPVTVDTPPPTAWLPAKRQPRHSARTFKALNSPPSTPPPPPPVAV
jgi:hypothetical protein